MRSTCRLHNYKPTLQLGQPKTEQRRRRACSYNEARLQALLEGQITLHRNRVMLPSAKQLPRLTGALRAFGDVSSQLSREEVSIDETLLIQKRKRKLAGGSGEKGWRELSEDILSRCSGQDKKKV